MLIFTLFIKLYFKNTQLKEVHFCSFFSKDFFVEIPLLFSFEEGMSIVVSNKIIKLVEFNSLEMLELQIYNYNDIDYLVI